MKCKGIIFISLILLLIMAIMPLTSHAANGGLVVTFSSFGTSSSAEIFTDSHYYTARDTIKVTTNFSRVSEGFYLNLAPQNHTLTVYSNDFIAYRNYLDTNSLWNSDLMLENGTYSIDLSTIPTKAGSYIVSLICVEKQMIYDYYIVIDGKNGSVGNTAIDGSYTVTVDEVGDTGAITNIVDDKVVSAEDSFNVNGEFKTASNSIVTLRTVISDLNGSDLGIGYALRFDGLKATWSSFTKPLCLAVGIKDLSNGSVYICGYLNNVNNIDGDHYTLFVPKNAIDGKRVEVILNDVTLKSYGSEYSLSWTKFNIFNVYDHSLNSDANYESMEDLKNAGDAISNVDKPDLDMSDVDIFNYVDGGSVDDIKEVLDLFYTNGVIYPMVMIVVSLMLVSYILFGKKG